MTPSVSVLTGFDCLDFQDFASGGGGGGGGGGISARNSRALSLFAPYFGAVWTPIRPVAEANK